MVAHLVGFEFVKIFFRDLRVMFGDPLLAAEIIEYRIIVIEDTAALKVMSWGAVVIRETKAFL